LPTTIQYKKGTGNSMVELGYPFPDIKTIGPMMKYDITSFNHGSSYSTRWLVYEAKLPGINTGGTESRTDIRVPSINALTLQENIKFRWPTVLKKAKEMETLYSNPVQSMMDLLNNLPGNNDTWQEIIDEPYG
jgi:hypothetical protein